VRAFGRVRQKEFVFVDESGGSPPAETAAASASADRSDPVDSLADAGQYGCG
jgi:hypothetical protein